MNRRAERATSAGRWLWWAAAAVAAATAGGCGREPDGARPVGAAIQIKGSDTMVNVAQAWAEAYKAVRPDVVIEVSGGGSGVGIAALSQGTIDIATSSRDLKPAEREQIRQFTGREPKQWVVGHDALAIYVHPANPIEEISIAQLAEICAEGGRIQRWAALNVTIPGVANDEIVRVSRQSSSGTYKFFREHALRRKDFRLGSRDMNGSMEVVELVGATPTAIGYGRMGYHEPNKVRMLKVASTPGPPAVPPTVETGTNKTYPIARSLLLYTLGEPEGEVRAFLDWVRSDAGQRIVADCGYVPLLPEERPALPKP